MKARAKDVLQNYKQKIPPYLLVDIERVLSDLYQIRDNENETDKYYNNILHADYRFVRNRIVHDREHPFTYNEGEIDKSDAEDFRFHLLELVKNDPSFGYIFHQLGMDHNGDPYSFITYDCVPKDPNILFHIKYTWEDLKETIINLPDTEKLRILITAKAECQNSNFPIELKNEFIEKCETEICMIRELMALTNIIPEPSIVDKSLANTSNEEKSELFTRDICDFIEEKIKGAQYRSNHHAMEIFNYPSNYGCKIRFIHKVRTLYLIKILYKYLIHINKLEEAENWIKDMAEGLSTTRDDIMKSVLRESRNDTRFKAILLKQFKSRGMSLDEEKTKE